MGLDSPAPHTSLGLAMFISRLDYYNSVLCGLPPYVHPPTTYHCSQRLIRNLTPRDHVTPPLVALSGFPIKPA